MNRFYPASDRQASRSILLVGGLLFSVFCLTFLTLTCGTLFRMSEGLLQFDALRSFFPSILYPGGGLLYLSGFLAQWIAVPWIGASLTTVFLWCAQWLTFRTFGFTPKFFLFSYLPSFLLLALFVIQLQESCGSGSIEAVYTYLLIYLFLLSVYQLTIHLKSYLRILCFLAFYYVAVSWSDQLYFGILVLLLLLVGFFKRYISCNQRIASYLQWTYLNLLGLSLCCIGTASWADDGDNAYHERAIACAIKEKNQEVALQTGRSVLHPSKKLVLLRNTALAQFGKLGEHLFDYPQPFASEGLLPECRERVSQAHPENQEIFNYRLATCLLEKDLPAFFIAYSEYVRLYPGVLPKHYAEAVVLYKHFHPEASFSMPDQESARQFADFLQLRSEQQSKSDRAARNSMQKAYGNTYWWYYFYA